MKFFHLVSICALLASPVAAQEATNTSTNTNSNTASGAANAANNLTVIAQAGDPNPANTSVKYSGHTYTTPSVAGSYFGGTNPCLVGTGGGAAGGPIGFSLNVGKSDAGCTRRSDAAAWHAMGFDNIAIARMCQDQGNADAFFAATGKACPGTNADDRYKDRSGNKAETAVLRPQGLAYATLGEPQPVVVPVGVPVPVGSVR